VHGRKIELDKRRKAQAATAAVKACGGANGLEYEEPETPAAQSK